MLAEPRRFETPNAVMHSYASRGLAGTELALWRVDIPVGGRGPMHTVDTEQVILVLSGEITAIVDGVSEEVDVGQAVVLPAGVNRQIHNRGDVPVAIVAAGHSGATASTESRTDVAIPWMA